MVGLNKIFKINNKSLVNFFGISSSLEFPLESNEILRNKQSNEILHNKLSNEILHNKQLAHANLTLPITKFNLPHCMHHSDWVYKGLI